MNFRKRKPELPDESDLSGDPFTEEERKLLRKMMEEERYAKWFWASARQWGAWILAIVTGIVILRDNIKAILQWFVK